jgi:hypothetical protein
MLLADTILAAGFATPMFALAGLALAAIPIIIHFLNRRRFKTVPWAAMDFLLRAMRKNRRRLRFEQWILLATRCAVIMLAALALARPMGCHQSTLASIAGQRTGLHIIVVDNSYSMAYEADRPDARTHLDQAKILAKGVIDRLYAGGESIAPRDQPSIASNNLLRERICWARCNRRSRSLRRNRQTRARQSISSPTARAARGNPPMPTRSNNWRLNSPATAASCTLTSARAASGTRRRST